MDFLHFFFFYKLGQNLLFYLRQDWNDLLPQIHFKCRKKTTNHVQFLAQLTSFIWDQREYIFFKYKSYSGS